jgi:hypothetical protein
MSTFFKTIKAALLWQRAWETRRHSEIATFEYVNGIYNPRKRRSAVGWKNPLPLEAKAAKISNRSGTKARKVQNTKSNERNTSVTPPLFCPGL